MKRVLCGSFALPLSLSIGCSTTGGGTPPDGVNPSAGGSGQHTGSSGNRGGSTGYTVSGSGGTGSQTTSTAIVAADSGCAAQITPAELTQVNIIVLLDKSGSMGDQANSAVASGYDWQNCTSRWNPVADALKNFFADANSGRLYASLSFLPADGDEYAMCTVKNYSTSAALKVPLTLLDDTGRAKFTGKLCDCSGTTPEASGCIVPSGGTPTLAAVQGTIEYAATIEAKYPGSETVIVFLTDGEPGFGFTYNNTLNHLYSCDDLPTKGTIWPNGSNCLVDGTNCTTPDDEVQKVSLVIQKAPAKSIYVAGVGTDLSTQTLDTWATASGNDAINLLNMSGSQAGAALMARLESIRKSSIKCEFPVPPAASGNQIAPDKTNVSYKPGTGDASYLLRTNDGTISSCGSATDSWYFDNPTTPSVIKLCPSTCDALQSDPNGKIQVVFGCQVIVRIL